MKNWNLKNNLLIIEVPKENRVGELQIIGASGAVIPFKVAAFDERLKDNGENPDLEIGCSLIMKPDGGAAKFRFNGKEYGAIYFHDVMAIEPATSEN